MMWRSEFASTLLNISTYRSSEKTLSCRTLLQQVPPKFQAKCSNMKSKKCRTIVDKYLPQLQTCLDNANGTEDLSVNEQIQIIELMRKLQGQFNPQLNKTERRTWLEKIKALSDKHGVKLSAKLLTGLVALAAWYMYTRKASATNPDPQTHPETKSEPLLLGAPDDNSPALANVIHDASQPFLSGLMMVISATLGTVGMRKFS